MSIVFEDESWPPETDEFDVCHHGVGFDEECEECELEIDLDFEEDDSFEQP